MSDIGAALDIISLNDEYDRALKKILDKFTEFLAAPSEQAYVAVAVACDPNARAAFDREIAKYDNDDRVNKGAIDVKADKYNERRTQESSEKRVALSKDNVAHFQVR